MRSTSPVLLGIGGLLGLLLIGAIGLGAAWMLGVFGGPKPGGNVNVNGTTPPDVPAFKAELASIPGGTFEMGTGKDDVPSLMTKFNVRRAELFEEEIPRHRVSLSPFFMDKFEVTNGDFAKFVRKHPEWQSGSLAAVMQNGKYLSAAG